MGLPDLTKYDQIVAIGSSIARSRSRADTARHRSASWGAEPGGIEFRWDHRALSQDKIGQQPRRTGAGRDAPWTVARADVEAVNPGYGSDERAAIDCEGARAGPNLPDGRRRKDRHELRGPGKDRHYPGGRIGLLVKKRGANGARAGRGPVRD